MRDKILFYLLIVHFLCLTHFCGAANGQLPVLSIAVSSTQSVVGVPVLLKATLHNADGVDYVIRGQPGWGTGLSITYAQAESLIGGVPPDVRHGDTLQGPVYIPVYWFGNRLGPGDEQCLLHLVQIQGARPGPLRLKANVNQGTIVNSEAVVVSLVEAAETQTNQVLTAEEKSLLYRLVTRLHNRFGTWRASDLGPIIHKAKACSEATVDTEYALYAGALQGIARDATTEDRALAKEAAKAFLERFPKSWLRAHVYAALVIIHRKEGDTEAAAQALKAGQALPESRPLFQNLGLVPEVKEDDDTK